MFAELIGGEWHCPDLPGHGPDPQLDCTPVATVEFLERELTTIYSPLPTPKNILLGYSLGARAALQHAVAYPEVWDALILISPNPGIEDPAERAARRSADEVLAQRIERHGALAFIEFWKETQMIRSQKTSIPRCVLEWPPPAKPIPPKASLPASANSVKAPAPTYGQS